MLLPPKEVLKAGWERGEENISIIIINEMKENLSINLKNTSKFISFEEIVAYAQQSVRHLDTLNTGTGPGNDFLGWLSLPDDILPST